MVTKITVVNGTEYSLDLNGNPNEMPHERATYRCKSTDVKPIEGVNNADKLYEIDGEHNFYLFDADTKTWEKQ